MTDNRNGVTRRWRRQRPNRRANGVNMVAAPDKPTHMTLLTWRNVTVVIG